MEGGGYYMRVTCTESSLVVKWMERGLSCAVALGMQVERVGRGRGVGKEG